MLQLGLIDLYELFLEGDFDGLPYLFTENIGTKKEKEKWQKKR